MEVVSYGGARTVTGSCHLLRLGSGRQILIDCGLYQGLLEERNLEPFGFDPTEVDLLILTHAHLDHIGRLPLLYRHGFRGRILATKPTFELGRLMLYDAAKVMAEDYATAYKKALRRGEEHKVHPPLYSAEDVRAALRLGRIIAEYGKWVDLGDLQVRLSDAGHIIGSASLELEANGRRIAFSGDVGNKMAQLLPPPTPPSKADTLFLESTYGDRLHRPFDESVAEFEEVVRATIRRGGNVLIPSFATERAQQILCVLKRMSARRRLPPKTRVFLDSPMAVRATRLYDRYRSHLGSECQKEREPFGFAELHFATSTAASKKINEISSGAVIIAGSGMCTGGRILHHLKHRIWDPKNAIIFTGYQAKGTLGRKIVDGAKVIYLFGERVVVRSSVHTIGGFSAHADQHELMEWAGRIEGLEEIALLHGEPTKQRIFAEAIKERLKKRVAILQEGLPYAIEP